MYKADFTNGTSKYQVYSYAQVEKYMFNLYRKSVLYLPKNITVIVFFNAPKT